ncbi:MAG: RusA family crossover junction endodeoxyribonuclease [Planctomycetes bacterium]|nr:RusA family crossover junction endodeoxyribonuclease [Planctomycetota bacterium]
MVEVELPYPPSINHYWRRVGYRTLISKPGRVFREQVIAILSRRHQQPFPGPVAIDVKLFPPDRRRRDLDNSFKSLFDSLQHGGLLVDDSQIVELHARKHAAEPGGKVLVHVRDDEGIAMTIDGWIARGRSGFILGSFRLDRGEVEQAAWQLLRIIGGTELISGIEIVPATLVVRSGVAGVTDPPIQEG